MYQTPAAGITHKLTLNLITMAFADPGTEIHVQAVHFQTASSSTFAPSVPTQH